MWRGVGSQSACFPWSTPGEPPGGEAAGGVVQLYPTRPAWSTINPMEGGEGEDWYRVTSGTVLIGASHSCCLPYYRGGGKGLVGRRGSGRAWPLSYGRRGHLARRASSTLTRDSSVLTDFYFHSSILSLEMTLPLSLYLLLYLSLLLSLHLIVQSLQAHFILTISHWSSGLTLCFPSQGTWVQIPWGVLLWNRDSPVSVVLLLYHLIMWADQIMSRSVLPGIDPGYYLSSPDTKVIYKNIWCTAVTMSADFPLLQNVWIAVLAIRIWRVLTQY